MLIDGNPLEAPAAPLNDLLRPGLDADPGAVALVSAVREVTWQTLDELSDRLAGGYLGWGWSRATGSPR